MKRLLLASTILTTAAVCFLALSKRAADAKHRLRAAQSAWQEATQRLAEVQSDQAGLLAQARVLQREPGTQPAPSSVPPALAQFLSSNDVKNASAEMQEKILAALGQGSISNYVLVTKESLRNSRIRPLKSAGLAKLTDSVSGVLAITPDERKAVEAAFASAYERIGTWANANVQRDGPSENMLVRYTIPVDQAFERGSTEKLFGEIGAVIGEERGQLLHNYFQHYRIREDGAIGDRTNILEIHRISKPPGLGYRSGWTWTNAETINTYPEPIPTNSFPAAFSFIFPGGWQEIAEREGFELPAEFKRTR